MYIKPELVSLENQSATKTEVEETKRKRNCCSQRKKKKITAYNAEITTYLQSVFFDIYSKQSKLTKQQRREVQEKTGLPSRNITYWFSNHKRRFQISLNQFKKKHTDSSLTYLDFIKWRRKQSLPDHEISQSPKKLETHLSGKKRLAEKSAKRQL
ncbi:hypothetical protein BY458DRAFT_572313 [Sporodiniella umbellata]|nr:hypothetical protein BY458DRAFT_572313 [Sporodiniella umbellata]